ncbi:hypothetical protein T12_13770 [Trichinella patagoniensis]|uniref:Uncharacterized protein n=1 Tax=Trichinella patagoniensis TaxID=990121 RepID=A0A0V0Z811_9BILA|nr:hypothetical protein T12_13770 [Trichinella patagoniensis]
MNSGTEWEQKWDQIVFMGLCNQKTWWNTNHSLGKRRGFNAGPVQPKIELNGSNQSTAARSSNRLTAKPKSWSIQGKQSQDKTNSFQRNDCLNAKIVAFSAILALHLITRSHLFRLKPRQR